MQIYLTTQPLYETITHREGNPIGLHGPRFLLRVIKFIYGPGFGLFLQKCTHPHGIQTGLGKELQ